jgi:hypothetical protein
MSIAGLITTGFFTRYEKACGARWREAAMTIPFKTRIIPAGLALLLLALGLSQTADSVFWLMTGDSPDQLGKESPASPDLAAKNAVLLERADAWFGDPKARIRAGILRLRLLGAPGVIQINPMELARATDDIAAGLARAPANAFAWAALAQAEIAAGNGAGAKRAFTTSLLVADHDPDLSLWRCELGLRLWPLLDGDDRDMWNDQVRLAWDRQRTGLLSLARRDAAFIPPIRIALTSEPAQLAAFENELNRSH